MIFFLGLIRANKAKVQCTSMDASFEYFDAHTHVQFSGYDADRDAVISRAREAGVRMVTVGTQRDTSAAAVALAERYPGLIYAAVGLHPAHTSRSYHDAQELGGGDAAKAFTSRGEVFDFDYYKDLAMRPEVVAIGECGLDYYHFSEDESKEDQVKKQRAAFIAQIELSREVNKPLMIHCRNALPDLIGILNSQSAIRDSANPGIIHFFTGIPDEARALLDLGFSFTFGGVITFARSYDEIVALIPMNRILSETDAPYVAPVPYRGKRNEPAYVIETVKKLAELKGVPLETMAAQIEANAKRIFQKV
jgi:TatD DNase family protein